MGLLLASFTTNAQRQDQTRILFVFDASYSMYGDLQQRSKITVAKNLLSSLVDSLAEQRKAGHAHLWPPNAPAAVRL